MSKAILILDEMPNECMECPLRFDTDDRFRVRCYMSTRQVEKGKRLENCPLKPLKENYISIDWLKQNIPFQNEEDRNILLSMLDVWRNKDE